MGAWHPPIPAKKLYSKDALDLGAGIALLIWCYDGIERDGHIDIELNTLTAEFGVSYRTLKEWWAALRDGPFFHKKEDRGRRGWRVWLADDWIDWHVMGNNYPATQGRNNALEDACSSPAEGQEIALDPAQVPLKSRSSPAEGQNVALDDRVYKVDHHDQESGVVAARETRSQRPTKKARDPTPAIIRQSLADVCGLDLAVCSKENALNINVTAKRLYEAGQKAQKTPEETADTIRYVAGHFSRSDWRGKKGELPTPKQLVDVWGAAIAARKSVANSYSPPPDKPADALPPAEAMRRVLEARKQATK